MVTQSAGHAYPTQDFRDMPTRIKTGSYTGDGATSFAITGVGFKPRYVQVWTRITADGATTGLSWETTTEIIDDNASGMAFEVANGSFISRANAIISLDADGFTVDDAGADSHPNRNGTVYNYLALG